MKPEVVPGILEQEWSEIERKLNVVKRFSNTVHIDLIDGKFADNKTFLDPKPFKKYSQDLFFELHMMVVDPEKYLEPFAAAGFKRFMGHIEQMSDQTEFIARGELLGEVGLALDGETPVSAINVPLDDLDTVLIYTSEHVGFSGPKLNPQRLEKVRALREKYSLPIEVDGGINDETIKEAFDAGATRFVTTSFIYNHNSPSEQFSILRNKLGLTK